MGKKITVLSSPGRGHRYSREIKARSDCGSGESYCTVENYAKQQN